MSEEIYCKRRGKNCESNIFSCSEIIEYDESTERYFAKSNKRRGINQYSVINCDVTENLTLQRKQIELLERIVNRMDAE